MGAWLSNSVIKKMIIQMMNSIQKKQSEGPVTAPNQSVLNKNFLIFSPLSHLEVIETKGGFSGL